MAIARFQTIRQRIVFPTVLGLFAFAGCSFETPEPSVGISGRVKFEGKPIQDGLITYYPPSDQKGRGASGRITNGYYSIPYGEGPYPGFMLVQVVELEKKLGKTGKGEGQAEISARIPKIYNFYTTLSVNIPDRKHMYYSFDLPAEHLVSKP